jgi:hypothetical protein
MKGSEVAWRTLNQEDVHEPCILASWLMKGDYYSRATGHDYWANRDSVYIESLPRMGVNLCPQFCPPFDRRGMAGYFEEGSLNRAGLHSPEEIIPLIEALPSDEHLERDFDVDAAADEYGRRLVAWRATTGDEVLFIGSFGQADFMCPQTEWGCTNYLTALALYPEHIERYYRYSATRGRLHNQAIVEAVHRYGLAPYVYSGQDICTNTGPLCSVDTLERIFFPHLQRAVQPLIDAGIRIIWHCDGDIRPILDPLLRLGISGLQGFQEETGLSYADMVKRLDRWGRPLIIWGCVSVTTTFYVSVDAVKEAVRRSFRLAGRGRGFGLAATSSIMPDVPDEHIDAFYQYGREFGRDFLSGRVD